MKGDTREQSEEAPQAAATRDATGDGSARHADLRAARGEGGALAPERPRAYRAAGEVDGAAV